MVEVILSSTASLKDCTYRKVQPGSAASQDSWVSPSGSLGGRRQSFNFSPQHLQAIFQNNPMSGTDSSLPFTVTVPWWLLREGCGGGEGQGKASLTSYLLATAAIPSTNIPPMPTICSVVTQRGAKGPIVPDQVMLTEYLRSQDVIKERIK